MNDRLKKLHAYMESHDVDALLITHPKHVFYLTGFLNEPHERFMGLVLSREADPFLIVPLLDLEKAEQASNVANIWAVDDSQNPYELLRAKLPARIKRLGIEEEHLHVARYRAVMEAVGGAESIDVTGELQAMRASKTPEEIHVMKQAIRVIEEVLSAGLTHVKPGVTELDLVAELEYQMKKRGADGAAFATIVLSGEKASQPHGVAGSRTVKTGELLLIDAGVHVAGYHSDITRTFAIGDVDEKLADLYETVLQANLEAIKAVHPDCTFASIDQAARQIISQKGYGEYFLNRVGHGLGLELHEYPSVHGNNQDIVREGMVFTIEPGIYIPQYAGVRIEDDVLVTADGVEVLTSFPKALTVIGV